MGILDKLGGNKLIAKMVSKSISKEEFLAELEVAWRPVISKNADVDKEVILVRDRIKRSGYGTVFDTVGITDEDIRGVITRIQDDKPDPIKRDSPKIGRNDPCPCGSGKKYKRCHGE